MSILTKGSQLRSNLGNYLLCQGYGFEFGESGINLFVFNIGCISTSIEGDRYEILILKEFHFYENLL